ncbi:cupin domain-containing protein [Sphingosinicella sp. BN140058]|nr:cupin domain-containing protein [Sphingosinicella sp. BN140058]
MFVTAGTVAAAPPAEPLKAAQAGITRVDLDKNDLGIAGREAVRVRVDFAAGAEAARHSHPGEELVYVLAGTLEYRLDGHSPVTLRTGDVLFIPADAIHAVRNVGAGTGSELATYVVEKGKPLVVPAK